MTALKMGIATLLMMISTMALGFEPTAPAERAYSDAAKKITLTRKPIEGSFDTTYELKTEGTLATWSARPTPAEVLISGALGRVVFLGGHGDPGVSLGKVVIHDLTGKALASINLADHIRNLEALSEAYRTVCCPFPWIHSASLSPDERTLKIDVCNKTSVSIDLTSHAVTVR